MRVPHRAARQISAYIDGELTPAEQAEFRAHLEHCASCRREEEELRRTSRLIQRLAPPAVPQGLADAIGELIERQRVPRRSSWPRPALVVATAVLVVVLVAVPALLGHRDRLRAAEVGPDVFVRLAAEAAAGDPFMDRAFLGLVTTDASLRLAGEDPRGRTR